MKKALKILLWVTLGLAALLLAGAGTLLVTLDPAAYKPLITHLVKEKKQRTLNIEGDIRLTFWPRLGLETGRTTLSARGSDAKFASVQRVRASLAILPLLQRELVLDAIEVHGLEATLVRYRDGTTNFDDLLIPETDPGFRVDIASIRVSDARIMGLDEASGRRFFLEQMHVETGSIRQKQPIAFHTRFHARSTRPDVAATLGIRGNFLTQSGGFGVSDFIVDAQFTLPQGLCHAHLETPRLTFLSPRLYGDHASLRLDLTKGEHTLTSWLSLENYLLSPQRIHIAHMIADVSGQSGGYSMAGKGHASLSGDPGQQTYAMDKFTGHFNLRTPAQPDAPASVDMILNAHADFARRQIRLAGGADTDVGKIEGQVTLHELDGRHMVFDLHASRLELQKLLGLLRTPKSAVTSAPPNLSWLRHRILQGRLNLDAAAYGPYRLHHLALRLKSDGNTLRIAPLSVRIDDSTAQGSIVVRLLAAPTYALDLDVDRINAARYVPAGSAPAGAREFPELSVLRALNATGQIRISRLQYETMEMRDVRIGLDENARAGAARQ